MSIKSMLPHTCDLWKPTDSPNGYGGITRVYSSLGQNVLCQIRPLRGDEINYTDKQVPIADYRIILLPRTDFKEDYLILWDEPVLRTSASGTITGHDGVSKLYVDDSSIDEVDGYWRGSKLVAVTGEEEQTKIVQAYSFTNKRLTVTEAFTITLTDDETTYTLYKRIPLRATVVKPLSQGSLQMLSIDAKKIGESDVV